MKHDMEEGEERVGWAECEDEQGEECERVREEGSSESKQTVREQAGACR